MNLKLFLVFIVSYIVIKYFINNILLFDVCLFWIMFVENNFNKIYVYLNIIVLYFWFNILKYLIYNILDRDSEMISGCFFVLVMWEKMVFDLFFIIGD